MQENPSYTAAEEVVSMEPNPCYSAVPAITDGETIRTISCSSEIRLAGERM